MKTWKWCDNTNKAHLFSKGKSLCGEKNLKPNDVMETLSLSNMCVKCRQEWWKKPAIAVYK